MFESLKIYFKLLSSNYQKIILDYKVKARPRDFWKVGGEFGLMNTISKDLSLYSILLSKVLQYTSNFLQFRESTHGIDSDERTWNNGYLPGLDIVTIYGLTRILKPRRIIEVGSGNSTRIFRRAITDEGLNTKMTSIDPNPRVNIYKLSDSIIKRPLEEIENIEFICND